jgi:hypothetical protein
MDHALSASFRNYSMDPRRYNTVPGQFSEWLHGETLVNQGMMLSPWFPPRYLWAAIEGAAGLDLTGEKLCVKPRLASNWKWLGVRNVPYRGKKLAWVAVKAPELTVYCTFDNDNVPSSQVYQEDITFNVHAKDESICVLGLRRPGQIMVFVGGTSLETTTTAVCLDGLELTANYSLRRFDSLFGGWEDKGDVTKDSIINGHIVQIEHQGFCLLEVTERN